MQIFFFMQNFEDIVPLSSIFVKNQYFIYKLICFLGFFSLWNSIGPFHYHYSKTVQLQALEGGQVHPLCGHFMETFKLNRIK